MNGLNPRQMAMMQDDRTLRQMALEGGSERPQLAPIPSSSFNLQGAAQGQLDQGQNPPTGIKQSLHFLPEGMPAPSANEVLGAAKREVEANPNDPQAQRNYQEALQWYQRQQVNR